MVGLINENEFYKEKWETQRKNNTYEIICIQSIQKKYVDKYKTGNSSRDF